MREERYEEELARLIGQLVYESGDPHGFDPTAWVTDWVRHPVPALGWRKPIELLTTPEGFEAVRKVILRMQTGAYS